MSETTIGISRKLKRKLKELKTYKRDSYEDMLWRIIEKSEEK